MARQHALARLGFAGRHQIGGAVLQPAAVGGRIVKSVDVIEPDALEFAFGDELEDEAMADLEEFRIFHRKSGEIVDVEEPAVVDVVRRHAPIGYVIGLPFQQRVRSEEHTSELQSLMRISYAVFCLKKKKQKRSQLQTTK